jgi:hypothetical protein
MAGTLKWMLSNNIHTRKWRSQTLTKFLSNIEMKELHQDVGGRPTIVRATILVEIAQAFNLHRLLVG